MKDNQFLQEVIERMESAYEPDEIVAMLELTMEDVAVAFEPQFIDLAFNLGFMNENESGEDDGF